MTEKTKSYYITDCWPRYYISRPPQQDSREIKALLSGCVCVQAHQSVQDNIFISKREFISRKVKLSATSNIWTATQDTNIISIFPSSGHFLFVIRSIHSITILLRAKL